MTSYGPAERSFSRRPPIGGLRFVASSAIPTGTWKHRPEKREGAGEAKLDGYLEDHSYLIEGLLELYRNTFHPRWLVVAQELAETMLERLADSVDTLHDTSDDHEALITRTRDLQENATPSGSAMAITILLKLADLTNDVRHAGIAHNALAQVQPMMARYPLVLGQWLQALPYVLSKPREIALAGGPDCADTQAWLNVVREGCQPFQVVALGAPNVQPASVPLLQDRGLGDGQVAAYVCREFACQASVTKPEGLRAQLQQG